MAKKKRRPAQKSQRQAERAIVHAGDPRDEAFDPGAIRRPKIVKWGPGRLGERVAHNLKRRKPSK